MVQFNCIFYWSIFVSWLDIISGVSFICFFALILWQEEALECMWQDNGRSIVECLGTYFNYAKIGTSQEVIITNNQCVHTKEIVGIMIYLELNHTPIVFGGSSGEELPVFYPNFACTPMYWVSSRTSWYFLELPAGISAPPHWSTHTTLQISHRESGRFELTLEKN